jgi:hypothetical protein
VTVEASRRAITQTKTKTRRVYGARYLPTFVLQTLALRDARPDPDDPLPVGLETDGKSEWAAVSSVNTKEGL